MLYVYYTYIIPIPIYTLLYNIYYILYNRVYMGIGPIIGVYTI